MHDYEITHDISSFFLSFTNIVQQGFVKYFKILDSITIGGISILDILISIFIIGALVSVVMTMSPNGLSSSFYAVERRFTGKDVARERKK